MWKQFVYENNNYLIKLKPLTLFLTDLKSIWCEEFEEDGLELRFKQLNPLYIGADVSDELTALLGDISNVTVALSFEAEEATFEVKSATNEYPLTFRWILTERSRDVFFAELTLSLVRTVQVLETQRKSLCGLLEKKDAEIKEYKREHGAQIAREYLVTPTFNKATAISHSEDEKLLLNVLTEKRFLEVFATKHGDVTSNIQCETRKVSDVKKRKLKPYVLKGRGK